MEGFLPHHIEQMTLAEISLILDDAKRGPQGQPDMSDAEILAYAARWQQMTPLQRLRSFERL